MKSIKQHWNNQLFSIFNDWNPIFGRILVILVILTLSFYLRGDYFLDSLQGSGAEASGTDLLVYNYNKRSLALEILPFMSIVMINIISLYDKEIYILPYKTRFNYFKAVTGKIITHSTLFVFIFGAVNILFSLFFIRKITSWTATNSTLYQVAFHITKTDPQLHSLSVWKENQSLYHPVYIGMVYSIFLILAICIMTLFTYILILLIRSEIISYILMLGMLMLDAFSDLSIILDKVEISYMDCLFPGTLVSDFGYLCAIFLLLFLAGVYIIKRTDFRT
ncbi:hypothetical protein Q7A53_16965 [Halobacillus rhizosphaerae]|uniref:hypothetical protein n=1 Tax=Halobacillus rhizosphaerae TaxID=3064889 RepID=UPI00398A96FA